MFDGAIQKSGLLLWDTMYIQGGPKSKLLHFIYIFAKHWPIFTILRAKKATALARLSHRNSVCPSVRHTGGSFKNGAS